MAVFGMVVPSVTDVPPLTEIIGMGQGNRARMEDGGWRISSGSYRMGQGNPARYLSGYTAEA